MFNGIEISEALLLTITIIMSCLLLLTIAMAIWGFIILHNRTDKKSKDIIKKLKIRSETDQYAAKKLEKLKRKNKKHNKEYIWTNILVWSLLIILVSINLIFAVIPGWIDYAKKDYVIYEGEFVVHRYTRNSFIILEDGTKLYGALGLEDGTYSDTIVYSRRAKFALGKS